MMSENLSLSARQQRLEEIIFAYEKALDGGQSPDRQRLLSLHAELAGELRSYFADLDRFRLSARCTNPDRDILLVESFGEYEIQEEIGRGGMGVVLRSRDRDLDRDLAIKVMRPEHKDDPTLVRRFLKEAEIGAQLQHPGIVPVHRRGHLPDGRPYFTMRLVQGKTLASLLKYRTGAVELPHFLAVFDQVCRAMEYAHSRHVIHRDLKPANIMVGIHGDVQVMDWGLAKVLGEDGASTLPADPAPEGAASRLGAGGAGSADELSHTGAVMGTPPYMAPEQAQGKVNELDARCDVFSLGAILCEILTGRPPYSDGDVLAKARAADLTDALVSLDACGADELLVWLAMHCLSSNRDYRPRNAGEVARHLRAYLNFLDRSPDRAVAAAARAVAAEHKLKVAYNWLKGAAAALVIAFGLLGWTGLSNRVERSANPAPPLKATVAAREPVAEPAAAGQASARSQADNRRDEQTPVPQALWHASPPSQDSFANRFAWSGAFTPGYAAPYTMPSGRSYRNPFPHPAFSEFGGPTVPGRSAADFFSTPKLTPYLGTMADRPPIMAPDFHLPNASWYSRSLRSVEPLMFNPSATSLPGGSLSAIPEMGSIGRFLERASKFVKVP